MATEEEVRDNIPIKQFEELVKTLKDEYSIPMNDRPQRIGEIRFAPIDYTVPQTKYQDWVFDEFYYVPLMKMPTSFYVIKQPKPTRWQRFKNIIKKLIK
jgi:hypothetical protein